jgi:uncharacterized DUF497 family protein
MYFKEFTVHRKTENAADVGTVKFSHIGASTVEKLYVLYTKRTQEQIRCVSLMLNVYSRMPKCRKLYVLMHL